MQEANSGFRITVLPESVPIRFTGTKLTMTIANQITILRILLIPLFVVQMLYYYEKGDEVYRYMALSFFVIASVSDALDGYLARRFNQHSTLGAVLDPTADKLLLVSGILLLTIPDSNSLQRVPIWLAVFIFARDFFCLIGYLMINHACGKVKVLPHWSGKMSTVFQIVLIFWILIKGSHWWGNVWIWMAGSMVGLSSIIYIRDGSNQLNEPMEKGVKDEG